MQTDSVVLSLRKCKNSLQELQVNADVLLTFLLSPAGNVCAPLTPQTSTVFGPGSEMVQRVGLQSGDGPNLHRTHLHSLQVKIMCFFFYNIVELNSFIHTARKNYACPKVRPVKLQLVSEPL